MKGNKRSLEKERGDVY